LSADAGDATRLALALRLVRDALDITDRDREAWLARECGADPALRAEVERLMAADLALGGPLDRPLAMQLPMTDTDTDPRIGRHVGPFVLRALLGRGGMGAVYRAERSDGGFTQTVALKLLRPADRDDPLALRRFAQERQILVRLQHPHIARFLDGGVTDDAQPWYAMELVEGETLIRYADRLLLPLRGRLALLQQICDAVQFAHQNLVLHRDLKPANILVDASGQAKLLDFGIAKLLLADDVDSADAATRTEHRACTPDYAAPEQIRGEAVGTAADIYALGVIAFELLTGRRPYQRSGGFGVAALGEATNPDAPSRVLARETGDSRGAAALRGDIDTIVLTCLQAEPARRYSSAGALKRDLERHLDGLPIEARPDSFGYRASKFVQRHRFGVALGAGVALALVAATVFSITLAGRAERESARATALAASLQEERDAVLEEVRRQDLLREHFVVVINRATSGEAPITPEALLDLAANPRLLGDFGDEQMKVALHVALSEVFLQQGDFIRVLALLDEVAPLLEQAPSRTQALAAATRADALIRIGKLDEAEAAIAFGERAITPGQHDAGFMSPYLLMLKSQVRRARGDLPGAVALARESATRTMAATDTSPLQRGLTIGSASTAMLQAGELDDAIAYADQAESIWREARVIGNVYSRILQTNRAIALFVRGNLLAAKNAMDAIAADDEVTESNAARAARGGTHAKLLALLARPEQALAMVDASVKGMCGAVGETGLDCLRARLTGIDTHQLAGRADLARTELEDIAPLLVSQPPLQAAAAGFTRTVALRLQPDETTLTAVLETIPPMGAAGGIGRRNAVRSLLMLAEAMVEAGRHDYAHRLARAAIETAGDTIDGNGMDHNLLLLWKARLDAKPLPADALASLALAIGAQHPYVVRWTSRGD
jgi:tetratricopeptide (TPR) repeat protein